MESQNRLMFVLAAVLLALVALIVLVEPPEEGPEEGDTQEWRAGLPGVEADRVQALELRLAGPAGEELRRFVRHEDGWRIAAPVQAAADQAAVEALVDAFARVELGEVLDGAATEYGLEPPRAIARLEVEGGAVHTLRLGRDAPVGGHTYVEIEGEEGIRPTRSRLSANLAEDLLDYRDRRLWQLPATAVDRVRFSSPEGLVELEQRQGDWWVRAALAGPDGSPPLLDGPQVLADPAVVDAAVYDLAGLRAERFLPPVDGAAADWVVEVEAAGARQALRAARVDGAYVASAPLHEEAVVLPADWAEDWLRAVPEWWSDQLVRVMDGAGAAVSVELDGQRVEGRYADGAWSPAEAQRVVDALRAIRADRSPRQAEGEAAGRVVVTAPDGSTRTLRLHQETEDGGRVVVDEAGGAAFLVPGTELGRLRGALELGPG